MKLYACVLLVAIPLKVVSSENESKTVCRDYLRVTDYFPNGTSCVGDNIPNHYDLSSVNITISTGAFLEQHCCAFGGGDKIAHDNPVFDQLRKFTGMSVSDFHDQHSPSQKALFWLVKEDSYPNMKDYLHIGQRFALSSIFFGLNGDTDWLECSEKVDTSCSVPNNKSPWLSNVEECNWAYLSCDRNSFVTEIIMPSNVVTAGQDEPKISSDIGLLGESLEKVNFRNNRIGGTIPTSIGSLILLTSFDVSYNNLHGALPDILFTSATGLEVLRVGHNSLTGTIPDLSLSQLRELDLSFNNFAGNVASVLADVPKLANVNLLATSLTGIFPSDVCNRSFVDPSISLRLECPLSCNSTLKTMNPESDAPNDCGGFGSEYCIDNVEWYDQNGNGCDWYETNDDLICPKYGHFANDNDTTANDACCYCGGGEHKTITYNTTDAYCTNDVSWTAIVGNETISCDWFEDNDDPGCANTYIHFLMMDGVTDPRESCCYCSEYGCQDLPGWRDGQDYGCDQYEKSYLPECPGLEKGTMPDENGITAHEACCHCAIVSPPCYDYIGWVDTVYGIGCDDHKYWDDPGCPYFGYLSSADGILAKEACCHCGGGESINIPSASPSLQYGPTVTPSVTPTDKPSLHYKPTVTPSVTPTDKPSHKYEPTVSPSETPPCYDYFKWVGYRPQSDFGLGCDWYEKQGQSGPVCSEYGSAYPNEDGIVANEACCHCGGGWSDLNNNDDVGDDNNHAQWQNVASTKYLIRNHQSCEELEYYISILNNQTYNGVDLTDFYCNDLHNGTVLMKDACCICNPNQCSNPLDDDNIDNDDDTGSCMNDDIQISKPWPQRNCEWFARDASRCGEFGASTILIEGDSNVPQRSANEVCCVCGGGTRECREFNVDWIDSHPEEPFNCSQYESQERCAADGSGLISLGHNANTQCCICGGGYSFKNNNVIVNATNQTCLDERDWQSTDFTCSSFVDENGAPDVEQCLALGHITSIHGVNASEGCCECWYGYDADTGGGYRGMLLGKMLRIGMMNYTDLQYVHNVTDSGDVEEDSTIYEFVKDASESYGFGLTLYDMNELNESRGLNRLSNNTYTTCLDALSLSLVDLCIGPYKNSTFPPGTKSIKGLYIEEYILVVRESNPTIDEYLRIPLAPLHYKAWALVTVTLIFLTCLHRWFALGFFRITPASEVLERNAFFHGRLHRITYYLYKFISVFFYFFTYIANGAAERYINDDGSVSKVNVLIEKIIVVSISVFIFFTVIIYGSSTAAGFVKSLSPHGPEYESLQDLFINSKRVCFHNSFYDLMERKYPTNTEYFVNTTENDIDRLRDLQNDNMCDGVVISRYSLSFISTQIESCKHLYPLYDEELFTQDIIVAISQTLGALGDELVNVMDIMSSKNLYRDKHDYHSTSYVECTFDALGEPEGVVWKSFLTPFIFSVFCAGIALTIGFLWKARKGVYFSNRGVNVGTKKSTVEYDRRIDENSDYIENSELTKKHITECKEMNQEEECQSHTIESVKTNNNKDFSFIA